MADSAALDLIQAAAVGQEQRAGQAPDLKAGRGTDRTMGNPDETNCRTFAGMLA